MGEDTKALQERPKVSDGGGHQGSTRETQGIRWGRTPRLYKRDPRYQMGEDTKALQERPKVSDGGGHKGTIENLLQAFQ